jgi:hypothetical protein
VVGGYDCVVEVGSCWVGAASGPAVALASAPTGEGCQWYIASLRAFPALY